MSVSFWANCPNIKKEGKPYIYKTEYQELGNVNMFLSKNIQNIIT